MRLPNGGIVRGMMEQRGGRDGGAMRRGADLRGADQRALLPKRGFELLLGALALAALGAVGCGGESTEVENPLTDPEDGPPAGNTELPEDAEECDIPAEAGLGDVSNPTSVIGDGTPESCTSQAVIDGIAAGGVITFDCGDDPIVITLEETAKIYNDTGPEIVIDGGGKVTLSGGGARRILYMNTCDEELRWTTDHCDNQDHPRVSVQNLTFVDGNASGEGEEQEGGGGAIWARGGRIKLVNTRFFNNVCAEEGADVGGGAVRAFSQSDALPVYVVNSTFGGEEELGNRCSNGGGISSIGVNWTIINSLFTNNVATGNGGNPAEGGTPGGGSGGAIYNDGGTLDLRLCGTRIEQNTVNMYGAAIFFISNSHDGDLTIESSIIRDNEALSGSTWQILPGISAHDDTRQHVDEASIIE